MALFEKWYGIHKMQLPDGTEKEARLSILKDATVFFSTELRLSDNAFTVQFDSEDDELPAPIKESQLDMHIWSQDPAELGNVDIGQIIQNIQEAEFGEYFLQLRFDGVLKWEGPVITDNFITGEGPYPREVTISAKSGLNYLDEVPRNFEGTRKPFISDLDDITDQITEAPFTVVPGLSEDSTSDDPFNAVDFDPGVFRDIADSKDEVDSRISYRESLMQILKTHFCQMFMWNGRWQVRSPTALIGGSADEYQYDRNGENQSKTSNKDFTTSPNGSLKLVEGSENEYREAYKRVTSAYEHRSKLGSGEITFPPHFRLSEANTSRSESQTLFSSGTERVRFQGDVTIDTLLTLPAGVTGSGSADFTEDGQSFWYLEDEEGSDVTYTNVREGEFDIKVRTKGADYTWDGSQWVSGTDATVTTTYSVRKPVDITNNQKGVQKINAPFQIDTAPLPDDANITDLEITVNVPQPTSTVAKLRDDTNNHRVRAAIFDNLVFDIIGEGSVFTPFVAELRQGIFNDEKLIINEQGDLEKVDREFSRITIFPVDRTILEDGDQFYLVHPSERFRLKLEAKEDVGPTPVTLSEEIVTVEIVGDPQDFVFPGGSRIEALEDAERRSKQILTQYETERSATGTYEHGTILFGDGPSEYAQGRMTIGGSQTDQWSRIGSSESDQHRETLTKEILYMLDGDRRELRALMYGDYEPTQVLRYDGDTFMFVGGRLRGKAGTQDMVWEATFVELKRDDTVATKLKDSFDKDFGNLFDRSDQGLYTEVQSIGRRQSNQINDFSLTTTTSDLSGTISSVPINAIGEALIEAGDFFYLWHPITLERQELVAGADVADDDTSITLQEDVDLGQTFPQESLVYLTQTRIQSGIIQAKDNIRLFAQAKSLCKANETLSDQPVTSLSVTPARSFIKAGSTLQITDLDGNQNESVVLTDDVETGDTRINFEEELVSCSAGDPIYSDGGFDYSSQIWIEPGQVQISVEGERDGYKVAELDENIPSGSTKTSVSTQPINYSLQSGEVLTLVAQNGDQEDITLSADASISDASISINSHNFSNSYRKDQAKLMEFLNKNPNNISRFSVQMDSITADTDIFKHDDWDGTVDSNGNITSFASVASWAITGGGHFDFTDGSTAFRFDGSTFEFVLNGTDNISWGEGTLDNDGIILDNTSSTPSGTVEGGSIDFQSGSSGLAGQIFNYFNSTTTADEFYIIASSDTFTIDSDVKVNFTNNIDLVGNELQAIGDFTFDSSITNNIPLTNTTKLVLEDSSNAQNNSIRVDASDNMVFEAGGADLVTIKSSDEFEINQEITSSGTNKFLVRSGDIIEFYSATTKLAELDTAGNLDIAGSLNENTTF